MDRGKVIGRVLRLDGSVKGLDKGAIYCVYHDFDKFYYAYDNAGGKRPIHNGVMRGETSVYWRLIPEDFAVVDSITSTKDPIENPIEDPTIIAKVMRITESYGQIGSISSNAPFTEGRIYNLYCSGKANIRASIPLAPKYYMINDDGKKAFTSKEILVNNSKHWKLITTTELCTEQSSFTIPPYSDYCFYRLPPAKETITTTMEPRLMKIQTNVTLVNNTVITQISVRQLKELMSELVAKQISCKEFLAMASGKCDYSNREIDDLIYKFDILQQELDSRKLDDD